MWVCPASRFDYQVLLWNGIYIKKNSKKKFVLELFEASTNKENMYVFDFHDSECLHERNRKTNVHASMQLAVPKNWRTKLEKRRHRKVRKFIIFDITTILKIQSNCKLNIRFQQ